MRDPYNGWFIIEIPIYIYMIWSYTYDLGNLHKEMRLTV